jgi:NAD-dependent deacetylase
MTLQEKIDLLQSWIDESNHIVFFSGAGVSTDSGIPDFRSQDGLYNQEYKYPPEEIISHSFFEKNPEEFYRFYKNKMLCLDVQPNLVHKYIASLEERGKCLGVITQNIDGLHTLAGSKHVEELHGSVHRNYCMKCGKFYSAEYIKNSEGVPRCKCGGMIKPDVVLYEESLNNDVLDESVRMILKADLLIVLGSSLVVYPAAGLLRYFQGDKLVMINRTSTTYDSAADLVVQANFKQVFPRLTIKEK